MDYDPEFSIRIAFSNHEAMLQHLKEYGEFLIAKKEIPELPNNAVYREEVSQPQTRKRPENDRRGKHTGRYHQLARQFHIDHPHLTYRQCYKAMSGRDLPQDKKEEELVEEAT
jgi:hypothetical protein